MPLPWDPLAPLTLLIMMRSSMKRVLINVFSVLLLTVMCGCDNPRLCPKGVYRDFKPDAIQGYSVKPRMAGIWLVAKPFDGTPCLPRDLTVRNLVASEGCRASVLPPGWVKGRPLMAVYADYGRHATKATQTISFDIYQGEAKKQTVRVSITKAPDMIVSVDGKQLKQLEPN